MVAQASQVSYELHTLGWKAFQDLCATIVGEIWGQTVQSFSGTRDGGRDGAFRGTWAAKPSDSFEGSFTIQCKFTTSPDKSLQLSDINDELEKAKRLVTQGLADNYFLFTNAKLTATSEQTIGDAFRSVAGVKTFSAHGHESISRFIRESSRLRILVPRVYGLGDLSQILDERAQDQARELLSSLGEDLKKFVITEAYRKSIQALIHHGFVLLLGEPACGKSTIGAALALAALDEWQCSTFRICDADDFVAHSNPHEPRQFFWVDDAFGATQIDFTGTSAWNRVFPHMQAAIRRGARVLFTSRDYIYKAAREILKISAFPLIADSQVVIHVDALSKEEREQILYNHIRLGSQPKEFKTQLKPLLTQVSSHPQFSPETARRLGNPAFTKNLGNPIFGLGHFVEHPIDHLCEIIRTIDAGSKSALALLFMRGGVLPSPIETTPAEERAIALLGGTLSKLRIAMGAMDGGLVVHSTQSGTSQWRFKHPTVRDAFAAVIAEDHELLDIYLAGCTLDRLFDEITCGDVGIQGVKVIVPAQRFEYILDRLQEVQTKLRRQDWARLRFLSYRCSSDFLALYIQRNPTFLSSLKLTSQLSYIPELDVVVRLHEFGLLPEFHRAKAAATIQQLAVETPDAGFLRSDARELLTADELRATLEQVRSELLPNLNSTIDDWRSNYDRKQDEPEGYFYPLVSTLEDFQLELSDDEEADGYIRRAFTRIKEVIRSMESSEYASHDYGAYPSGQLHSESTNTARSIFDDIDA